MKLLTHSQTQRYSRWSLWMWISNFTPHFNVSGSNYLSMSGFKLIHVSKMSPDYWDIFTHNMVECEILESTSTKIGMLSFCRHLRHPLQWCHNELDGVWNHQRLDYALAQTFDPAYQRKHQSSASLAFVRGIHRLSVDSPHKGPVTRKTFPFDGVIMILSTFLSLALPKLSFCELSNNVRPKAFPLY